MGAHSHWSQWLWVVTVAGGETVSQVSWGRGEVGSLLAVCGHRLNNGRKALDLGLAPGFHIVSFLGSHPWGPALAGHMARSQ